MARHHLSVSVALFFFALVLPLAAARLGGRSCHTSFFFPDLNNRDLRTLTLLRADDSNDNGASADLKIFSIAAAKLHAGAWIEHLHLPPTLVQVRLLNLRRQTLLNPGLSQALDAPREWRRAAIMDNPFAEQPTHKEIMRTWSVSTSNPRRPITWIDIHSRRGMLRHEFSDHMEQEPPRWDDDDWVNDLWRMAFGLLFGAATGMVFAVTLTLIWSILRRLCAHSHDKEDVGFLYGYQELPSAEADVKGSRKEFTKEKGAGMVENM